MKTTRVFKAPLIAALVIASLAGLFTVFLQNGIITTPNDNAYFAQSRAPLVDINEATISELTVLDGIGYSRASAIVAYREKNGAFKSIRDIMNVPGIGEAIFNEIRNQIYV